MNCLICNKLTKRMICTKCLSEIVVYYKCIEKDCVNLTKNSDKRCKKCSQLGERNSIFTSRNYLRSQENKKFVQAELLKQNEHFVCCKICNKRFKQITNTHLYHHNITS